ncbi:MAG: Qc-snare protein, Tlg1/Syntaxin 6-family [Monoraphidium minutum]|nr:MAG: Qc-snare protein, Tlg1/Syntaxin 6-family [Monoraphidium minutum]
MEVQDPFYLVRQEIQDTVNELQHKMSRFHGLTAANPERRQIAASVRDGCDSLKWQLKELEGAVDRAAEQPARFNLAPDEIAGRRKWVGSTRRVIEGMLETLATAAAAPVNAVEAKVHKANESFIGDEGHKQQLIMKQQDHELEDIEQAVTRLGRVGLTIHEELESQGRMLDELDEDVDTTHSRLRATQKKIMDVIRKSGTTTQLGVIAFLVVVLLVLVVLTFSPL